MAKAPFARRYAQALFALASEHGRQEAWAEALARLEAVASEPTVALYFAEPRIGVEARAKAVALLAESHISVHSWPETQTAICDIFTCSEESGASAAMEYMQAAFKATGVECTTTVTRSKLT